MARVLVEKDVLFSGIWRPPHSVDDRFLRKVSNEFLQKPSAQSKWRLTSEGVIVLVSQSASGRTGQTDLIPVTAIKDVTVNRYNPLCLMTLYVDPNRRFNALVCKCQSEKDAGEIVQVYRDLRKSFSGEGYRIDLKQPQGINWTLQNKPEGQRDVNSNVTSDVFNGHAERVVVEVEEEALEREALDVGEGRQGYNVGVQAELGDYDSDRDSISSDMSLQSLRDELYSLSSEVREIKKLLARTAGISTEEYFKRQPDSPAYVPVQRSMSEGSDQQNGEKQVSFASDDEEFDIRSVGMQTEGRGKYAKRSRSAALPVRFKPGPYRMRTDSNTSSQASGTMVSPAVSYDPNFFPYANHGHRIVHMRRDPRLGGGTYSKGAVSRGSTVVRPIESVYHTGPRHKRGQIVVFPQRASTIGPHMRVSAEKGTPHPRVSKSASSGGEIQPKPAAPTDTGDKAGSGNGVVVSGEAVAASR